MIEWIIGSMVVLFCFCMGMGILGIVELLVVYLTTLVGEWLNYRMGYRWIIAIQCLVIVVVNCAFFASMFWTIFK